MKTLAVVPAYNENQTIASVVRGLKEKVDDVIVVDDGSSDNTYELAKNEGAKVLRHFLNRGQGAALKTGIDFALSLGADIIITFDADEQHDVGDIEGLVRPIVGKEVDIVLGSRFIKPNSNQQSRLIPPHWRAGSGQAAIGNKIPFSRFLILKIALLFTRITIGLKITDTHNGLRALSRNAAEKISILQDGMAHASEILEEIAKHELRYVEVPVTVHYTEYSRQKGQSIFGAFRIIWDLVVGKISK